MTTANPIIVAALRDNTGLIRAHGAALKDDPDLWGRYQRNREIITTETVKAAAKRKEVASC